MAGIVIVAHTPIASAMLSFAEHTFGVVPERVRAVDIPPHEDIKASFDRVLKAAYGVNAGNGVLILTDVMGATPANVAQKLVAGSNAKLIAGVNLPMLYRVVCYRHEPLDALVARALTGGTQGVMQVAITAPQNQNRRIHDQNHNDHQQ